jgi:hypothetical protein
MERELPNTIYSCLSPYQRDISKKNIEIIVANNDNSIRLEHSFLPSGVNVIHNGKSKSISPAKIINKAVKMANSKNLLVIIDGARMLSPKVLSETILALERFSNLLVTPIAFHLGPKHQSLSMNEGYSKEVEDQLLETINWKENGNDLFKISSLAGANPDGFFGSINESCAIGISKKNWKKLNGLDENFNSAGGGLSSLDLFKRAVEEIGLDIGVLLNCGSFHQLHGGASTSPGAPHAVWHDEYSQIRGSEYVMPNFSPIYLGKPIKSAAQFYKVDF